MFLLLVESASAFNAYARFVPRSCSPRAGAEVTMTVRLDSANVPLGMVSMNPFQNLKQMQDQRVAHLSHINLAPGLCTLPLPDAIALMKEWKTEIADDLEKFEARAKSDSHCLSAADGGDLGYVTRQKLSQQFDDILYQEEPGKVYGPITTPKGLHLIYLHSCREPMSSTEALFSPPGKSLDLPWRK